VLAEGEVQVGESEFCGSALLSESFCFSNILSESGKPISG